MKDIITVENLSFDYEDRKNVLSDISFSVSEGETLGFIGPNGAGKTTLFHLLCGILEPKTGKIRLKGKEVRPKIFNPVIGYIFQNPDDQLFSAIVYDDLAFGPLNLGLSKEEANLRVNYALEITGCSELKNRSPHHLSGGEKRMVSIASILTMKPEVIIYDEPTSNLDMRVRRSLITFINSGKETTIVSSHDLEFVLEICERVIILDRGKIVADGISHEVMDDKDLMLSHGLERPHSLLHGREHNHQA